MVFGTTIAGIRGVQRLAFAANHDIYVTMQRRTAFRFSDDSRVLSGWLNRDIYVVVFA